MGVGVCGDRGMWGRACGWDGLMLGSSIWQNLFAPKGLLIWLFSIYYGGCVCVCVCV